MNIMFLIDALEGGGAERACLGLAAALCSRHQVYVVAVFRAEPPGYYIDPRIHVEYLNIEKRNALIRKLDMYCRETAAIRKLKKAWKIDCCISFLVTANYLNALTPVGERQISSVRNYYSKSVYSSGRRICLQRYKIRYAGCHSDAVVGVSKAICEDLTEHFRVPGDLTHTIYNFYSPTQRMIENDRERFLQFCQIRESASPCFITAGRMVPQKGQWHLIRAFRQVIQSLPDAKLVVLGQGPLEDYLRAVIAANRLDGHVSLLGFDPACSPYLRASDIYVCSSLFEGFSNSILEALACGVPVISTDCSSGPRELLAPETDFRKRTQTIECADYGVLVPVCSGSKKLLDEALEPQELCLAEAMVQLAGDGEMKKTYAERAAVRMMDFSPEKIVSQWEALINEVTGKQGGLTQN